jgi:ankyrin repeat protein
MGNTREYANNIFEQSIKGDLDRIKEFLEAGVNVNVKDQNGTTALMYACIYDNPEIMKFLLENGADVNVQDPPGRTALIYASMYDCSFELVKNLVEYGANVNVKDVYGESVLDIFQGYTRYTDIDTPILNNRNKIWEYLRSIGDTTSNVYEEK